MLLATRLRNQHLATDGLKDAAAVVGWLGAVQAQDHPGAKWALALRAGNLTDAAVERAFADGRILRTHVMRPTWHFVARDDIRWMQALTGPRVHALNAYYAGKLAIDARLLTRGRVLIEKALEGGQYLTRDEIADVLRRARIEASGQRLAYIVMALELDAVICSGPRRGKQFTYALVDERAPRARTLPRDEALAELARRYFQSHGPATARDFAWWSGLTVKEARVASAAARVEVLAQPPSLDRAPGAHYLLPNYDEYLIAYKDRGAVVDGDRVRNLGVFTSDEYPHHVVLDGRVAGSWQRLIGTREASVALKLYAPATARQMAGLRAQAARYGRFLGMPCALEA